MSRKRKQTRPKGPRATARPGAGPTALAEPYVQVAAECARCGSDIFGVPARCTGGNVVVRAEAIDPTGELDEDLVISGEELADLAEGTTGFVTRCDRCDPMGSGWTFVAATNDQYQVLNVGQLDGRAHVLNWFTLPV